MDADGISRLEAAGKEIWFGARIRSRESDHAKFMVHSLLIATLIAAAVGALASLIVGVWQKGSAG